MKYYQRPEFNKERNAVHDVKPIQRKNNYTLKKEKNSVFIKERKLGKEIIENLVIMVNEML